MAALKREYTPRDRRRDDINAAIISVGLAAKVTAVGGEMDPELMRNLLASTLRMLKRTKRRFVGPR